MQIDQIGKIIDLCRKKGVESLQIDGLSLKLTPEAPESLYKLKIKAKEIEAIKDPVGDPITEAANALFWSIPNTGEGAE